jgi:hypothetical protein
MPYPDGTTFETVANMRITYRVKVTPPGATEATYADGFKSFDEAEAWIERQKQTADASR